VLVIEYRYLHQLWRSVTLNCFDNISIANSHKIAVSLESFLIYHGACNGEAFALFALERVASAINVGNAKINNG